MPSSVSIPAVFAVMIGTVYLRHLRRNLVADTSPFLSLVDFVGPLDVLVLLSTAYWLFNSGSII